MLSVQAQRIKALLYKNIKNAPAPTTVQEAREQLEKFADTKIPEGIKIESVRENSVIGEWISSSQVFNDRVVVYFHGGGFIIKPGRGLAILLSRETNCRVFSVDYRLAPEHPFPAALEDALATYHWLLRTGTQPKNIIFIGDSAGGGLALAALAALRDSKEKLPAGAVLITPWLDLLGTGDSRKTKQESDPWYNPDSIMLKAGELYADVNDRKNPLISPLYADLYGLPPILIHAAGDDTLVDDSTRLFEKWKGTGIDIRLELWDGLWHVWHYYGAHTPEAQEAIKNLGKFVKDRLNLV